MMDLFVATLESTQESPLLSLATIGAKVLTKRGQLTDLDESEEINACTIMIFPGQTEATAKHYRCNPDVTFAAGNRVLIARVSGSYVVLCKVGKPK